MTLTPEEILAELNQRFKNTLMNTLEMTFVEYTTDSLTAKMPVNSRVHQPFGMLHGGASVALAESVGSAFSNVNIDVTKYYAVGTEISAHHLNSISSGEVFAKASFIKKGKTNHVLQIEISDESGKLICHSKMTNMILPLNK